MWLPFVSQRRVQDLQRRHGIVCRWVFPHLAGRQRAGRPRKDFTKRWKRAVGAAGLPGMLKHDFQRTAARDMERQGVPRSVAMKIIGHKTESMYRRYTIVSDADLKAAAERMAGTLPAYRA